MFPDTFSIRRMIMLLLCMHLLSCSNGGGEESKSIFQGKHKASSLKIKNGGEAPAVFYFRIHRFPYNSIGELLAYIRSLPDSSTSNPEWMKAWKFMIRNSRHERMITRENWLYHPLLLINSAGGAYCGFRASALAHIWAAMGYKTRVWGLNGHVVPEIFTGGRWMMLDPDLEVYYLRDDHAIAGVEELTGDTTLITAAHHPFPAENQSYAHTLRYSSWIASMYASVSDNAAFDWSVPVLMGDKNPPLTLPSGAELEFPVFDSSFTVSGDFGPVKTGPYLKVVLPEGQDLNVVMPFILCCIRGDGTVIYNGRRFDVMGSLSKGISSDMSVFSPVAKASSNHGLQLFYMIHLPPDFDFRSPLEITGKETENLSVQFVEDVR